MEQTGAFLLGVSLKIVDEVLDKDIELSEFYLELFKTLTVVCLTIASLHDFPFAISTVLSLGLSYFAGGIDQPYWWAFFVCAALLACLSFTRESLTIWLLPAIWVMPFIVYGEALVFPENSSLQKMLGSALMIPLLIGLYHLPFVSFLKQKLSHSGLAEKAVLFGIGYFAARASIKAYINLQRETPSSQPTVLAKETTNTKTLSKQPEVLDVPSQDDAHSHVSDSDNVPLKSLEVQ